jgi:hypothetical protein
MQGDPRLESQREPGLDLHEWETRWAELEEMFEEDPFGALPLAVDIIEAALDGREDDIAESTTETELDDELKNQVAYAREVADKLDAGADVSAGDVAAAIQNLRDLHDRISAGTAP